ncbi:MAG: hypothetical protein F7C07_05035 [Desulfurococcales archaeon]|nr:hypothetical protein [Desulfurococcales archaeon]
MSGYRVPFVSRLLLVIGLAIAVSGVIAETIGAKTGEDYELRVYPGGKPGVAFSIFALGSSGSVDIEIRGADRVFNLKIRGDPISMLRQLATLNISLVEENVIHDVRTGVIVGKAAIDTYPGLIALLPVIAGFIPVEESESRGVHLIREEISSGEGVLIIATPLSEDRPVEALMDYRVQGYSRLSAKGSVEVGALLASLSFLYYAVRRRAS